jgi:hypothetical protein
MSTPKLATKTMRMKFMYIQSDAYPFVFDECCKVHSRFRLEAAQDKELHAHLRDSAGAVSFATLKHQGAARRRLVKVDSSQREMRTLGDERKISDNETSGADDFRLF